METPSAHIFIVEDDQLLALALSAQVEMLGYRVAGTANTAEEAVRGVLQARPQVVIMDLQLAGWGTGLDAARSIRRNLEVPIIFYTGHGNDHALKHEIASMGNAQLLEKPAQEKIGGTLGDAADGASPRVPGGRALYAVLSTAQENGAHLL